MLKHRSSKKARIHYFVDIFCKCISDYHQRDIQECLKAYLIVTIRIICSSHLVLFTPTTVLNILKCQGKPSTTYQFSSVQLLSHVQLFATPWIAARQASLSITNWSLLKLTSIKSVMPSSHLILCHPLLLLPPIPPSIRVFSNESTLCMRWPKYWSFSYLAQNFNSANIQEPWLKFQRQSC